MNLLQMKYAVCVAQTHSINEAARRLYVGQSALSRAIKELEASLGVVLFDRSAKGMTLTDDGEIFIKYAKTILENVDTVENMFKDKDAQKLHFSLSGPRASYISSAFTEFSKELSREENSEAIYRETNSMRTLKNILQENYKLGIIRYAEIYDKYYKSLFDEKNLNSELVCKFRYRIAVSLNSPLLKKEKISADDLKSLTEISHADPYVPSIPFAEVKKEELPENAKNRIFVFERASQFELLSSNANTFMWVSPLPEELKKRYAIKEIVSDLNKKVYKDILIFKKDYTLSSLDKKFIEKLVFKKREIIGNSL